MMDGREEVIRMQVQFLELEQVEYNECLCESIRRVGIIMPFIVRRRGGRYQVVLGRTRLRAAIALGMGEVPVIVRDLSDNEVLLLRIEEAVTQKGFQDRLFSERVRMVSTYYELLKAQGIRTDLVRRVKTLTSDIQDGFSGERYNSSAYVKKVFGISGRTLNRYMRLKYVIPKVLCCLDCGAISLRTAVELSYLPTAQQKLVMQVLHEHGLTLKLEQAELLRKMFKGEPFGEGDVLYLLKRTKAESTVIRVDRLFAKYGLSDCSEHDAYSLIDNALNYYLRDSKVNTNTDMGMGYI